MSATAMVATAQDQSRCPCHYNRNGGSAITALAFRFPLTALAFRALNNYWPFQIEKSIKISLECFDFLSGKI